MKFNKLAAALAVATVFGATSVAADAASFVRVPTVAGAQIANGGLAPAASEDSSSFPVGPQITVGDLSMQAKPILTDGYYTTSATDTVTLSAQGPTVPATVGVGTIQVAVQKGVVPEVTLTNGGGNLEFPNGQPYHVGISPDGSCNDATYDNGYYVVAYLPKAPSKAPQSYKLCAQIAPFGKDPAGPFTLTDLFDAILYSRPTAVYGSGDRVPVTTAKVAVTASSQHGTAPSSITCNLTGDPLTSGQYTQVTPYDVFAADPLSQAAGSLSVSCSNSSATAETVNYAVSTPASVAAAGETNGDTMSVVPSITAGATGSITVPANGSVTASVPVSLTVTLPAGQDVSPDTYSGNVPITLTY